MNKDWTLPEMFRWACGRHACRPAFTCLGKTISYRELEQLSEAFCAWLQHHTSLQPGDRIAIALPNLLQYPVAVFGALRAGLVIVNTNPLYTERELQHQFSDAGAKALLTLDSLAGKALAAAAQAGIETVLTTAPLDLHRLGLHDLDLQQLSPEGAAVSASAPVGTVSFRHALVQGRALSASEVQGHPDDIAALQYTGGTTGVAKGAMLSHRGLLANVRQVTTHAAESFLEGEEVYVAPLPLYHIYAFNLNCLCLVYRGGLSLLIPNPRDPQSVADAIRPFPFTGFVGINTLFNSLCRTPAFRELDFSHLRHTSSGGMALTAEIAREWQALTGIEIGEGYGMTETSPVISSNPRPGIQAGTVGLPIPDTELRVIDGEGNVLPAGEPGELCVRGPQVMAGYWGRPEATAEVLSADGWLRTGDVAVIQPDGYLRIVDRIKDMIVVSGFNVYPTEIEDVASSHAQVMECAAIGVPDARTGEAVKLLVVPAGTDFDTGALAGYLRERLTGYKLPALIEVRESLPKSNVGKILRRELQ